MKIKLKHWGGIADVTVLEYLSFCKTRMRLMKLSCVRAFKQTMKRRERNID